MLHRTVEAIVHPDGRIELSEPLIVAGVRRALVTILEERPQPLPLPTDDDAARFDAALRSAGLLDNTDDIPADLHLLSDAELDALWARNPGGTPLSEIIIEEREERF